MTLTPGNARGGDPLFSLAVSRWQEDAVDTDGGGVTATHAAETGLIHSATGIQCSGDAAALVTIEAPANTILWRKRFTGAFTMSEAFPLGVIRGAAGDAILVKVSAATTNSEANMQGVTLTAV